MTGLGGRLHRARGLHQPAGSEHARVRRNAAGAEILRTETGADLPWPSVDDTPNEARYRREQDGRRSRPEVQGVRAQGLQASSKMIKTPSELLEDCPSTWRRCWATCAASGWAASLTASAPWATGRPARWASVTAAPGGITTASAHRDRRRRDQADGAQGGRTLPHRRGWMFHDNILLAIRLLKDARAATCGRAVMTTGRPTAWKATPSLSTTHGRRVKAKCRHHAVRAG